MTTKESSRQILDMVASKSMQGKNAKALRLYDECVKTSNLFDKIDAALGRNKIYKSKIESTLNFEINRNAISSTTTQEI